MSLMIDIRNACTAMVHQPVCCSPGEVNEGAGLFDEVDASTEGRVRQAVVGVMTIALMMQVRLVLRIDPRPLQGR